MKRGAWEEIQKGASKKRAMFEDILGEDDASSQKATEAQVDQEIERIFKGSSNKSSKVPTQEKDLSTPPSTMEINEGIEDKEEGKKSKKKSKKRTKEEAEVDTVLEAIAATGKGGSAGKSSSKRKAKKEREGERKEKKQRKFES